MGNARGHDIPFFWSDFSSIVRFISEIGFQRLQGQINQYPTRSEIIDDFIAVYEMSSKCGRPKTKIFVFTCNEDNITASQLRRNMQKLPNWLSIELKRKKVWQ